MMERGNSYRLLQLKQILFDNTDENNELSIKDLGEHLKQVFPESTFDKRTLRKDMELLDDMDFEVIQNKGKYGKLLYSHQSRLFETYQLRLIIDAVLSARFITTKEKKHLIKKLKQLTSKHIAKTFPNPVLFSQSANMDYELVKLNIDRVHQAISDRKVLAYHYGKYNVEKEFEYGRDGEQYRVEPYALIWQNDNYYLIGRFIETDEMRHYRLDRIRNIEIEECGFTRREFHLQEYVDQSFLMFSGDEIRIQIRFHNDLVNVVLDRFGHQADIRKDGTTHFILHTKAKYSDGLVNWILSLGMKATVLSPNYLRDRMQEEINEMKALYEA